MIAQLTLRLKDLGYYLNIKVYRDLVLYQLPVLTVDAGSIGGTGEDAFDQLRRILGDDFERAHEAAHRDFYESNDPEVFDPEASGDGEGQFVVSDNQYALLARLGAPFTVRRAVLAPEYTEGRPGRQDDGPDGASDDDIEWP